jgi:hypothetical protein
MSQALVCMAVEGWERGAEVWTESALIHRELQWTRQYVCGLGTC